MNIVEGGKWIVDSGFLQKQTLGSNMARNEIPQVHAHSLYKPQCQF